MLYIALAYHYEQLEAAAFREEYNADAFEDQTEPNVDMIHKVGSKQSFLAETSSTRHSTESRNVTQRMENFSRERCQRNLRSSNYWLKKKICRERS